ncbi:hypothetical protein TL16_g01440 [Triparma laevis f. inornata]|uniref:Uncharacterized protein n=1 Tax=Triparma laevis f. inornata TaxID=1714386 RepID=A0A9W6ZFC9_9STRA|nr:hypothetical protein TL16_g01440 [Triparma laevis f. inornata]
MSSMFVDRMKNDPKFAAEAMRLQKAIAKADEPENMAQTYLNQNNDLTLDTRKEHHSSAFTSKEIDELGLDETEFSAYKQQRDEEDNHPRLDEIRVIAQTLAFSKASTKDAPAIAVLLNLAYNKAECNNGVEKFRTGDVIDEATVSAMIRDPGCRMMIAEVPDGKRVVKNGAIIAVCCYSVGAAAVTETDSSMKAKRKPAAIRLLAVMSEFWGLCVGQRMLQRAEKDMIKEKATQNILAVPSTRKSMASWLNRRGYSMTSQVNFPVDTVPFEVLPEVKSDLKLLIFEKKFDGQKKAKAR